MTEPMYRPIRRIMPDFGALDFSPLVVLLLIQIVSGIIIPHMEASLLTAGAGVTCAAVTALAVRVMVWRAGLVAALLACATRLHGIAAAGADARPMR